VRYWKIVEKLILMKFFFDVILRFSKHTPYLKGLSIFEGLRVTIFFTKNIFQ